MEIKSQVLDAQTLLIGLQGRLDANSSPALEKQVIAFYDQGGRSLVLDLGALEYISSAGLRVLILGAKKAKSSKGALALFGLQPQVLEVFEIAGFTGVLNIYPAREAALSALSGLLAQ